MNSPMTFDEYLHSQDRAELTISGYQRDLALFERWYAGISGEPFQPQQLTVDVLRRYRQELIAGGFKPNTINRKLAALAVYAQWALLTGRLTTNPALNIQSVESTPLAPKWLDKRQRAALTRAVESDLKQARLRYPRLWLMRLRDAATTILLLNTGLRVGELCALKLADVQLSERKATIHVRSGKGQKQRSVPVNAAARGYLAEWLRHRPNTAHELLFIGQRGENIEPRSVQRAVQRYAGDAGLPDVTPHTLRHSFAKSLLDEGVSLEKIAALLGHSSLNTTRIYTIPSEDDLSDAVERLAE